MSYPHASGVVVAMATWRKPLRRFTVQDRIDVLRWQADADQASRHSVVHDPHPADDPEIGDYLLVYRRGEIWARGAVTRDGAACRVWCFAANRGIGVFASMLAALDAAAGLPVPGRRRAS